MDAENFEERLQREVQQAVASSQKSLMDVFSGQISSKFSNSLLLNQGSRIIKSVKDLPMITLGYACFLRFDEMSNIKCNNFSFCADYVRIEITKSKTDQYRSGNEVLISKGCSSTCPYSMLERCLSLAGLNTESDDFYTNLYLGQAPFASRFTRTES